MYIHTRIGRKIIGNKPRSIYISGVVWRGALLSEWVGRYIYYYSSVHAWRLNGKGPELRRRLWLLNDMSCCQKKKKNDMSSYSLSLSPVYLLAFLNLIMQDILSIYIWSGIFHQEFEDGYNHSHSCCLILLSPGNIGITEFAGTGKHRRCSNPAA
jgi:hypothetical protein